MIMRTIEANSITSAFTAVQELADSWPVDIAPYFWFRGSKNAELSLKPGAYWRNGYTEHPVLLSFTQEGSIYGKVGALHEWSTYYLAQHHGIPTRLLDWTESFSASLYFAFDGWDGNTTPCIWVMHPDALNNVMIKWWGILTPENNLPAENWLPLKVMEKEAIQITDDGGYIYSNQYPLAIYPRRTNSRIAAQQGMFTVHGRMRESLEEIVKLQGGEVDDIFARVNLVGFDHRKILQELRTFGIRRAAIYPDMDNYVRDLQHSYEWT